VRFNHAVVHLRGHNVGSGDGCASTGLYSNQARGMRIVRLTQEPTLSKEPSNG
jgi:hypothetical protein